MKTIGRPRAFDERATLVRIMDSFRINGYDNTTFDQLVADSGLSRSSLYSAFGGKKELLDKAMGVYMETEFGELMQQLSDNSSARSAIQAMISRFSKDCPGQDCLVRKTMLRNATSSDANVQIPTIKKCLNSLWKSVTLALGRMRKLGKSPALRDEERAAILIGLIHGSAVIARNGGNSDMLQNMQSGAVKLLLR